METSSWNCCWGSFALRWTLVGEWKIVCHSYSMIFFLTLREAAPSLQTLVISAENPKVIKCMTDPVLFDKRVCANCSSLAGYPSVLVTTLCNLHSCSLPRFLYLPRHGVRYVTLHESNCFTFFLQEKFFIFMMTYLVILPHAHSSLNWLLKHAWPELYFRWCFSRTFIISLTPEEVPCVRHLKITFLTIAVHWWLVDHPEINCYISFFLLLFIFIGWTPKH